MGRRKRQKSSSSSSASSSIILNNVVMCKKILYGNEAHPIEKRYYKEGERTHRWTCYVRPFDPSDDFCYVKQVIFHLHDTFPDPTRIVAKPPFEISEVGWGEFSIRIEIFLSNDERVEMTHLLRLFNEKSTKKPVVEEHYEELVFFEPTQFMYDLLIKTPDPIPAEQNTNSQKTRKKQKNHHHHGTISPATVSVQSTIDQYGVSPEVQEKKDLESLNKAMKLMEDKIIQMQERLDRVDDEDDDEDMLTE